MNIFILGLLYGLAMIMIGAGTASGVWWAFFRRKAFTNNSAEAQHSSQARQAAAILVRLRELATRVALDVDKHNSQVEEINDKLTSTDKQEPGMIVDVVAKLIQSNQHMQEKLASTEDRLRDQTQQMQVHVLEARTDPLTLLGNRRALDDELVRRIAEFRRQGRVVSLIMVDVDHFKKFNDTHGHQTGDEVLQGVATLLRRTMREMDMVARYGGEEFAIVLPGTTLADACKAALRACEGIAKSRFRHGEKEFQVTASFGVAEVQDSDGGDQLMACADKALYAAKEGGRNCVFCHARETVHRVVRENQCLLAESGVQRYDSPQSAIPEKKGETPPTTENQVSNANAGLAPVVGLDVLPTIPKRAAFCQQVRSRTAEWKRGGPTFSIILVKANQYDQSNSDHGQQTGEFAAWAATRFLVATIREMDTIGDYGPGCFALLLPSAGLIDTIRVAERLREGFSQFVSSGQAEQPRLTLSVGVVQIAEKDNSISVLERAEAALEAADRRGGDRAYYHDGDRCVPITATLETMTPPHVLLRAAARQGPI